MDLEELKDRVEVRKVRVPSSRFSPLEFSMEMLALNPEVAVIIAVAAVTERSTDFEVCAA
jgi:hypothetical protein